MIPRPHAAAIPAHELERRWAAVRAYLTDQHADAFVVYAAQDYLGGYYRWFTDRPAYHAYGATAIFHADAPMTVVDHGELGGDRKVDNSADYPGVGRIRSTAAFICAAFTHEYEPALVIADLHEKKCRRVAVAGLGAMPHRMGAMLLSGGFELLDATDWLDEMKAKKSADELAAIRAAATLQDRVFARTLEQIRPGMIERDVMAIVQKEASALGSDQGVVITGSAAVGQSAFMRFPYYQERRIEPGDYMSLLIEVSGRSGYYCELGRIVCFGKAPARIAEGVARSREMQAAVLAEIRPGVLACDIAARYDEILVEAGMPPERRLFAHGQGYDLVERPLIRSDETMALAANMNLACHPGVAGPTLFTFVCDNHLVTETGTEAIHATPQSVFEI